VADICYKLTSKMERRFVRADAIAERPVALSQDVLHDLMSTCTMLSCDTHILTQDIKQVACVCMRRTMIAFWRVASCVRRTSTFMTTISTTQK